MSGNSGSALVSERGLEMRLPHVMKAAGARLISSWRGEVVTRHAIPCLHVLDFAVQLNDSSMDWTRLRYWQGAQSQKERRMGLGSPEIVTILTVLTPV